MKIGRVMAVFKREWLHILRDRRSALIIVVLPAFALLLTSYTVINRVQALPLAVVDLDGTAFSREVLLDLNQSGKVRLKSAPNPKAAEQWLNGGEVSGIVTVPPSFSERMLGGDEGLVQFRLGVADPLSARIYRAAIKSALERGRASRNIGIEESPPAAVSGEILFNPQLDHFAFSIPALIGCILMSILPALAAISVAREREQGSFNRFLASPASLKEFFGGKFLVYFLVALFQFGVLTAAGILGFEIPFRGSWAEMALLAVVYCAWTVLFGLFLASFTRNQSTALVANIVITLLPAFVFSGLYFPIPSLPWGVRWFAYLVPTQYFSELARGIFLKGHSWSQNWTSLAALALLTAATFLLTVQRLRAKSWRGL